MGAPIPQNWPGVENLPDYGKIIFKESEPQDFKTILMKNCKI